MGLVRFEFQTVIGNELDWKPRKERERQRERERDRRDKAEADLEATK